MTLRRTQSSGIGIGSSGSIGSPTARPRRGGVPTVSRRRRATVDNHDDDRDRTRSSSTSSLPRSSSRPSSRRGAEASRRPSRGGDRRVSSTDTDKPRSNGGRPKSRSGSTGRPAGRSRREFESSSSESKPLKRRQSLRKEPHEEREEPRKDRSTGREASGRRVNDLIDRISNMKRGASRGSEFTESTGGLSSFAGSSAGSCEAVWGPPGCVRTGGVGSAGRAGGGNGDGDFSSGAIESDEPSAAVAVRPPPRRKSLDSFSPLPVAKRTERKGSGGEGAAKDRREGLHRSLGGLVWNSDEDNDKRVPGRPKFLPPKETTKAESKSQQHRRSAFQEVKDASPLPSRRQLEEPRCQLEEPHGQPLKFSPPDYIEKPITKNGKVSPDTREKEPCPARVRPPLPPFSRKASTETQDGKNISALPARIETSNVAKNGSALTAPPVLSRKASTATSNAAKNSSAVVLRSPPNKERKTPPPPPPPPRKTNAAPPNPPMKSNTAAGPPRRRSFHHTENDLQALCQSNTSTMHQSQSFHDAKPSCVRKDSLQHQSIMSLNQNEMDMMKSHQANHDRANSLSQSMHSLHQNDSQQINHSKVDALSQSLICLHQSEADMAKPRQANHGRVNSLSQSMLSLHQNDAAVGLDLSKSEPAGLDHGLEFLDMKPASDRGLADIFLDPKSSADDDLHGGANKKNHRKVPSFFGKRNSSGTSNCLALVPRSSTSPPPQPEVKVPSTNNNEPPTPKSKLLNKDRQHKSHVVNMPYTDPQFGDSGLYSGEVDADKRPHGKGKMKYENGIFCEGQWANGMQDSKSSANRERIMSGFSSWKGQPKADSQDKSCTVYGMDWIDLSGMAGKYTGTVNADNLPDGKGVMKYDFGLIAEGEWIKGVLNGSNGQMAGGATVVPGGTVVPGAGGTVMGGGFPGGMSVVGAAANTVVSGLGMMSICGGAQGNMGMMQNPMMNPYGGMGGGLMPQMQMGQNCMPYGYDPSMMRRY